MSDSALRPARSARQLKTTPTELTAWPVRQLSAGVLQLRGGLPKVGIFVVAAALVLVAANAVVASQRFPNYGTWTGIRPLEDKLRLLTTAAASTAPDTLILGSSISDFGFSAEYFSQLVAQRRGAPYRAFNFSTGATEIVTLPKIYRLTRTVTNPRELLLFVPAGIRRANEFLVQSPDYILERAPIGFGLAHPHLLRADKALWDTPLFRDSAAIRDLLTFGRFANLPGQGSDLYPITASGDTLSFNYQVSEPDFLRIREAYVTQLTPIDPQKYSQLTLDQKLAYYFNDRDISAMSELRQLAEADNVRLVLVRTGPAAIFYPEAASNTDYNVARAQFYEPLAEALNARLINDIEGFRVAQYMVNDVIHLNRYGARNFTAHVAASYLGDASVASAEPPLSAGDYPQLASLPSQDPTVNQFASIIPAPELANTLTLRLTLVINHAVPPLPAGNLLIAARLPDGRDLIVPAQRIAPGVLQARFAEAPTGVRQLLLVRVLEEAGGRQVALNQPISDFAWAP